MKTIISNLIKFCVPLLIIAFLFSYVLVSFLFSEEAKNNVVQKTEVNKNQNFSRSSTVYFDPKTGEYLSTPPKAEFSEPSINNSNITIEEITSETMIKGGVKAKLPESFHQTIKTKLNLDNKISTSCDHQRSIAE